MKISQYSRKEVEESLKKAKKQQQGDDETVRLLFSPITVGSSNLDEVSRIYAGIGADDFDTVVIVETHEGNAEKKLPMVSYKEFETPFGTVEANDKLRNDFCDEDDDFFIDDIAFDESVSLYDQLMLLQCTLNDFSVLSIQITDENSFIVKELAFALEEILASRNALIIFCCEMSSENQREFEKIMSLYDEENMTGLMNLLNSEESSVNGAGAFFAGLIVARKWGLKLTFLNAENGDSGSGNILAGYAEMQKKPVFG